MTRPFPFAYCITLTQTPARRDSAVAHVAEIGLPVTMVQGVHGATWGLETSKWNDDRKVYKVPPGMVGLNLSHWMVWQYAWLAGHDEVLVLEDDCYFAPDFHEAFLLTYDSLPSDWRLLYVGTVGTHGKDRRWINDRLVVTDCPFGTHCYLVRREAFPVLLETMQEAREHTDTQLFQNALKGRLAYYVAWPSLAGQHSYDGRWPCTYRDPTEEEKKMQEQNTDPKNGEWLISAGIHDRWTEIHRFAHADLEAKMVAVLPPEGRAEERVASPLRFAGTEGGA